MTYLTDDLPGTGGVLRLAEDDFVVDEIPAYEPAGLGDHVFVTIEKRGLTTFEAVRRIARALGVRDGDIGVAGMKDRHAVTRQQLSLPPPTTPEAALALDLPGVRVLAAARHGNKLRTGHLAGNRFTLRVQRLAVPAAEAEARARAVLARLASPPGAPNFYGEQRFGAAGDNAARGRDLILGKTRPPRDRRQARLLVSACQSDLFNRYLERRIAAGAYARVLLGDVLRKVATGGVFVCADPALDQPRLEAGELAPTGPMFGHAMRAPAPGSPAAALEDDLLAGAGLAAADFQRVARIAEGTRRPVGVPVVDARAEADGDALRLAFTLPSGAYATVVAAEVMKAEAPATDPADPGEDDDSPTA